MRYLLLTDPKLFLLHPWRGQIGLHSQKIFSQSDIATNQCWCWTQSHSLPISLFQLAFFLHPELPL